ncbi:MAG: Lipoprotein signal peptidase [Candidatus Rifleibacterium amylolyticum]|nr:MAG: Lipoprotein signal peptidase [Candidatus Rifleibacterium amylolyticum]NLF95896.1 signal peptidase II [Candidatus Riflebacteria bacterium]
MKQIRQAIVCAATLVLSSFYTLVTYPLYVCKNLGYHLRSPSVLLYALIFFIVDRYTKLLVINNSHQLPVKVIEDFFTLTYVKNPGVAFGWFPDWRLPPIMMALTMIIIIGYYSLKLPEEERLTRWSLALLVGGAIGNLYDRILYGFVVDFFLFHLGPFDFPVFNIADIAIDLGVFMLFVDIFFLTSDEEEEENSEGLTPTSA